MKIRRKRLSKLKAKITKGYYMIPKDENPPKQIIDQLEFKPINYKKYKRVKNGKKKSSR